MTSQTPQNPRKSTPATQARVLIVDAQPLFRSGLTALLNAESDLMVCAEADDPRKATAAIRATQPDLVITDVILPGKGGIELIKDITTLYPELPVLVFAMHPELQYVERVMLAGARGYVLKSDHGPKLLNAIRRVLSGKLYVTEEMSSLLIEHRYNGGTSGQGDSPITRLSDRELQILELIGAARSSREIAGELIISIKTVESHRANIKQKLHVHTAQELMRLAVCWVENRRVAAATDPKPVPARRPAPRRAAERMSGKRLRAAGGLVDRAEISALRGTPSGRL